MWVIGGTNISSTCFNDIWFSSDGITWILATNSPGFSIRNLFAAVSYKNKIWVIGGNDGNSDKNDVWSSSDGILWTQDVVSAPFPPRRAFSSTVTDSLIFIYGGLVDIGGVSTPSSDAWYSNDGINWAQLKTPPELSGKYGHTSLYYSNKIWIIGQIGYSNLSDVWYIQ
jgi:hypothetical protein